MLLLSDFALPSSISSFDNRRYNAASYISGIFICICSILHRSQLTYSIEFEVRNHVYPGAILAVGNAPTALLTIAEQIESGLRPALVIGVPVGFVNVVESKERLFSVCEKHDVPAIVAMGRKGGSNVAAAICNALIYSAAEMLDPSARGWK